MGDCCGTGRDRLIRRRRAVAVAVAVTRHVDSIFALMRYGRGGAVRGDAVPVRHVPNADVRACGVAACLSRPWRCPCTSVCGSCVAFLGLLACLPACLACGLRLRLST